MNKKCCELLKEVIDKNYSNIRLDNMSCNDDEFYYEFKADEQVSENDLEKLENDPNQLETANSATANMYIVNPFKKDTKEGKRRTTSIWSTHPSTQDRIAALRNLK